MTSEGETPGAVRQRRTEPGEEVIRDYPDKRFAIRLWDGTEIAWGESRRFTFVFQDVDTFQQCFRAGDIAVFGDAFVDKRFDIEGDIYAALEVGRHLRSLKPDLTFIEKATFAFQLGLTKTTHSREEDTRDVQAHYDVSNDFYRLFLDEKMVYSCAYFSSPTGTLEEAQERKLDLICRKLRLQPGERFLDVGCGWGALLIWAAKHYGVKAHGITLSRNQYDLAKARIAEAKLEDRITVEMRHYVDLPENAYDKIASIGMVEHVGIAKYPEYFGALRRALVDGGLLLNHGITLKRYDPASGKVGGNFIKKYVFPGAELDSISHTLVENEQAGFEILDVEALRPHYAFTLREWYRRLTENSDKALACVPEKIFRIWKLYFAGFAMAFEEGILGIHQTLSAKNDATGKHVAPLTREDLFVSPLGKR